MSVSSSSGRTFLKVSPAQLKAMLEEEKSRRRKRRIQMTRQQSAEMAKKVRDRVRKARVERIEVITREELERYRQNKQVELALLQEEYQRCLNDIGMGLEAARKAEEFEVWKKEQKKGEDLRAAARGAMAMRLEKRNQHLDKKVKENRMEVKKSAIMAEKVRAAQLRQKAWAKKKVEFIEVDQKARQKVTLVDRRHLMKTPSPKKSFVRRVPLSEIKQSGLEAAIREQERHRRIEEEKRQRELEDWKEKQKAHLARNVYDTSSSTLTTTGDDDEAKMLSTILEVTEASVTTASRSKSTRRYDESEVDWVPVRGPSAGEEEDYNGKRRPDGPLAPAVPQPGTSSLALKPEEIEGIRSLLERVEKQKKDLTEESKVVIEGEGGGAKDNDYDRNFIARVLGISPDLLLKKPDDGGRDPVKVRINIEEESGTTTSSSNGSSNSISKERFLSQPLSANASQSFTDYQSIHTLIDELKSSTTSSASSPDGDGKRRALLQHYIEKLLGMRREEIANLSVSSSSISFGPDSLQSFVASTPASILSSSGSRSSVGSKKTVQFRDQLDGSFKENSNSSSSSSGNSEMTTLRLQKKKEDIEKRTQESLKQIQTTFEQQKDEIERALLERLARKENKLKESLNLNKTPSFSASSNSSSTTVSEGLLSSESVASVNDKSSLKDSKGTDSSQSTNSSKESSASSTSEPNPADLAKMLETLKINWAQSMIRRSQYETQSGGGGTINKSSSSGSSGSAALADMRAKLKRLEVPQLQRPSGPTTSTGEEDTLADPRLAELPSQDFSSFHFTPDTTTAGGGITEEPEISFISLSSDTPDTEQIKKAPQKH